MEEQNALDALFSLHKDEDSQYAQALGVFIEQFSITEFSLFTLLVEFSGMTVSVAQAAFGVIRTDHICTRIRKICEVKPLDPALWTEIDDFLAQVKHINEMRNNIIHLASSINPEQGRIITNLFRIHNPENEQRYRISPDIVLDMTADCVRITAHAFSLSSMKGSDFDTRAANWPQMKKPWLYKPLPNLHKKQNTHMRRGHRER